MPMNPAAPVTRTASRKRDPYPARGPGRESAAGRRRARPFGSAARLVQQATAVAKSFPASLGLL
jgi:hypothetical protein